MNQNQIQSLLYSLTDADMIASANNIIGYNLNLTVAEAVECIRTHYSR